MVFRDIEHDRSVLVLASGPDRVDEQRLAEQVGGEVEQARALQAATGASMVSVTG